MNKNQNRQGIKKEEGEEKYLHFQTMREKEKGMREEGVLMDLLSAWKYSGFTTMAVFSVRAIVSLICSVQLLQTNGYVALVLLFLMSLIFVSPFVTLPEFDKGDCVTLSGVCGFGWRPAVPAELQREAELQAADTSAPLLSDSSACSRASRLWLCFVFQPWSSDLHFYRRGWSSKQLTRVRYCYMWLCCYGDENRWLAVILS